MDGIQVQIVLPEGMVGYAKIRSKGGDCWVKASQVAMVNPRGRGSQIALKSGRYCDVDMGSSEVWDLLEAARSEELELARSGMLVEEGS